MTKILCIASRHSDKETPATHMVGVMLWPEKTDPKLRTTSDARAKKLNKIFLCSECQVLLTEVQPTPTGNALRHQIQSKNPELKNLFGSSTLDYSYSQYFFAGLPPEPSEPTGPPPPKPPPTPVAETTRENQ